MNAPVAGNPKLERLKITREAFLHAASEYQTQFDEQTGEVVVDKEADENLCRLADEYAKARWAAATKPQGAARTSPRSSTVIPFGRAKGKLLHEASKNDLDWLEQKVRESIDSPDKARFRDKNVAFHDEIQAELNSR